MARRPSPAMLVALLALFLAAGGGQAVASGVAHVAKLINGSQIKPNTITSKQVKDGSLLGKDFKDGELPAGAKGDKGDKGDPGPQGIQGPAGSDGAKGDKGDTGTVDTSNFYTKAQSDANYLGKTAKAADSDLLDGQNSTDFLGTGAKAADTDLFDGSDSSLFTRGISTSVGGNAQVLNSGSSNNSFLLLPGFGEVQILCGAMDATTTITYVSLAGGMMEFQSAAAVVTGGGVATTQALNNSLANGNGVTVLSAASGTDTVRHAVISVNGSTDAVTFDVTIVNKPGGLQLCRAAGTYVRQGGIGTF